MTVRNVLEGTIILILLVLLGAIGWQTVMNKKEVEGAAKVTAVAPLADNIRDLENKISELEKFRKEQTEIANNHSFILRQIAKNLSDGSHVPNIWGNMKNREFSQEVEKVVIDSISRPNGELMVYNDTDDDRQLYVNGNSSYLIRAKRMRPISVPSGNVTTEIAGDGSKSWFIGPPNYRQDLTIVGPAKKPSEPGLAVPGTPAEHWQHPNVASSTDGLGQ